MATKRYRAELIGPDGSTFVEDELPPYPQWYSHALTGRPVTAVRIVLLEREKRGGGLNEVVLSGRSASGVSRYADELLALLGAAGLGLCVLFPQRFRPFATKERLWFAGLAATLVVVGAHLVGFTTSVSAFEWEMLFDVHEFDADGAVGAFFSNLRVPIPPLLALIEIANYKLTGNIDWLIKGVYRFSIVGAYVAALWLAYPRVKSMLITFALSLLFIACTVEVHPGNPQPYDTVAPLLLMGFLALLSAGLASTGRIRSLLLAGSAISLSLAELMRPYMFVIFVPALVLVVLQLRSVRREALTFAICACALCVPWHAHLLLNYGQPTMSNHVGFNMQRGWPMVTEPPLLEENTEPPYRRLNNPQHLENSNRIRNAIIGYAVTHPKAALLNVSARLAELTEGKTTILPTRRNPEGGLLPLYRMAVRLLSTLLLLAAVQRVTWRVARLVKSRFAGANVNAVRSKPHPQQLVSTLLVGIAASSMLLLSLGESGEEGRFVISLLPLLAVVPKVLLDYGVRGYSEAAVPAAAVASEPGLAPEIGPEAEPARA